MSRESVQDLADAGQRKRVTSYRFRAYPTPEQVETLEAWQGSQRALWNAANAQRMERLQRAGYDTKRDKRWLSAYDQHAELTECREEFEWMRHPPQMMQCDLLKRLDLAWKGFFGGSTDLPRFKSKQRDDWAPMGLGARECKRVSRHRVRLPKAGDLRIRGHRGIEGRPLTVSLTREVDQWFVSIACEVVEALPEAPTGDPIGLDMGVANVVADSIGTLIENPRHRERVQRRLARAQRVMARRKPKRGQRASSNYRKAAKRVAVLHRKIRRQRADLLHNISHHYAKSHGAVVIEGLRASNMMASAKGTAEAPGRNVRAKAGLNRSIAGMGWYELRRQLQYKTEREGSTLVVVDPRHTSQLCAVCGVIDADNRQTQALFACRHCGHTRHADVNAAVNILARGIPSGALPEQACGGDAAGRPLKQEGDGASRPSVAAGAVR